MKRRLLICLTILAAFFAMLLVNASLRLMNQPNDIAFLLGLILLLTAVVLVPTAIKLLIGRAK